MTEPKEQARDTCVKCGAQGLGVEWFGAAFRKMQLRRGKPDPGILCGNCAGKVSGAEIADDLIARGR